MAEAKFREGERVMLKPTKEDQDMGYEQPEGTVLTPGAYTMVLWDEEWGGKMLEHHEADLELIK